MTNINRVNPKYRGDVSIAITTFRGDYCKKLEISPEGLREKLRRDAEILGKDYKVLAKYYSVNSDSVELMDSAIERVKSGEKVDLEKILE